MATEIDNSDTDTNTNVTPIQTLAQDTFRKTLMGISPYQTESLVEQTSSVSSLHNTEPLDGQKGRSGSHNEVAPISRNALVTPFKAQTEPLSNRFMYTAEDASRRASAIISRASHISVHYYKIVDMRQSETAWVLFTRHAPSMRSFVIKILRSYKDIRYNLHSIRERQQCQLEALRWNRFFSPEVYYGLARVRNLDVYRKVVELDELLRNPELGDLEVGSDYALVMCELPDNGRLDGLLCDKDTAFGEQSLHLLTKRIVQIHNHIPAFSIEEGERWAGLPAIESKHIHNMALARPFLETRTQGPSDGLHKMKKIFYQAKDVLCEALQHPAFRGAFEERVRGRHIKRCHGDLKTQNIIMSLRQSHDDNELYKYVWLLDAIDFNQAYCNIDVLSDLAMLVIDVEARTKSYTLAHKIVQDCFALTGQDTPSARLVLSYYLLEKAYVGTAISMVYDKEQQLGEAYLRVVELHMQDLQSMLGK